MRFGRTDLNIFGFFKEVHEISNSGRYHSIRNKTSFR